MFKRILTLCVFGAVAVNAQAEGFVFSPTLSYSSEKEQSSTATVQDVSAWVTDLRAGVIISSGAFLGGMYKIEKYTTSSRDMSGHAFGPSAGLMMDGISLVATYLLAGERDGTAVNSEYSEANGWQIDLGYMAQINGSSFSIGPQISYHTIKYDKVQVAGVDQAGQTRKYTGWAPYIAFYAMF